MARIFNFDHEMSDIAESFKQGIHESRLQHLQAALRGPSGDPGEEPPKDYQILSDIKALGQYNRHGAALRFEDGDAPKGWEAARRSWRYVLAAERLEHLDDEGSSYSKVPLALAMLGLLGVGDAEEARWLSAHLAAALAGNDARGESFASFACWLERTAAGDSKRAEEILQAFDLDVYGEIVENWDAPEKLPEAIKACLDHHVSETVIYCSFNHGIYEFWPLEIQALAKVRADLGLQTPLPEHHLLESPLVAEWPAEPQGPFEDKLCEEIMEKLIPAGFAEESLARLEKVDLGTFTPGEDDEGDGEEKDDDKPWDNHVEFCAFLAEIAEEFMEEQAENEDSDEWIGPPSPPDHDNTYGFDWKDSADQVIAWIEGWLPKEDENALRWQWTSHDKTRLKVEFRGRSAEAEANEVERDENGEIESFYWSQSRVAGLVARVLRPDYDIEHFEITGDSIDFAIMTGAGWDHLDKAHPGVREALFWPCWVGDEDEDGNPPEASAAQGPGRSEGEGGEE